MGRGKSKASPTGPLVPVVPRRRRREPEFTEVFTGGITLDSGEHINFDGNLEYGQKDAALTGKNREAIEKWEAKRVKNKIEYAFATDKDGNPVGPEKKGSKGSVWTPHTYHDQPGGAFTHNHPREAGTLGGTFSMADMRNFANGKTTTSRAAAKEGTYSISKGAGFDAAGFKSYCRDANDRFNTGMKDSYKKLNADYKAGKIPYSQYSHEFDKVFNSALVKLHKDYLAGQKKYGYTYTLEKR